MRGRRKFHGSQPLPCVRVIALNPSLKSKLDKIIVISILADFYEILPISPTRLTKTCIIFLWQERREVKGIHPKKICMDLLELGKIGDQLNQTDQQDVGFNVSAQTYMVEPPNIFLKRKTLKRKP